MTDSTSSLEDRILDWLSKNGYPLEMRTSRELAGRNFRVVQSHYFADFESGTPREIDVIGRLYSSLEPNDYVAIAELETFVAIECKSSEKPWVVFCETKASNWSIEGVICNRAGDKLLGRQRRVLAATSLVRRGMSAGHGVAQAFGGNSDAPFTAVMSTVKAAESKSREALAREAEDERANTNRDISLSITVLAAIVISAPLFECRLNDDGAIELYEVKESALVFRYPRGDRGKAGVVVHIVTESGLERFIDDVTEFHEVAKSGLASMIPPKGSIGA